MNSGLCSGGPASPLSFLLANVSEAGFSTPPRAPLSAPVTRVYTGCHESRRESRAPRSWRPHTSLTLPPPNWCLVTCSTVVTPTRLTHSPTTKLVLSVFHRRQPLTFVTSFRQADKVYLIFGYDFFLLTIQLFISRKSINLSAVFFFIFIQMKTVKVYLFLFKIRIRFVQKKTIS